MNWLCVFLINLASAVANAVVYATSGSEFNLYVSGVSTGVTIAAAAVAQWRDGWFA